MFGPKNPKRVAERQLNQARLDLLEVCTSLESYESNKRTLTERIARLEAYLVPQTQDVPGAVPEGRTPGVLKLGKGLASAAG